MCMQQVGQTIQGETLWGYEENNVRRYYLNNKLVAAATGNLEETSLTRYICLEGIWDADFQTTIVKEIVEL